MDKLTTTIGTLVTAAFNKSILMFTFNLDELAGAVVGSKSVFILYGSIKLFGCYIFVVKLHLQYY